MFEVFKKILKTPYYRNYAAQSGAVHNVSKHEDAIEDCLLGCGFQEDRPVGSRKNSGAISKNTRDNWIENPSLCDMPLGSYMAQPCGTHNSPDFIVKDVDGNVYFLECKSVKGGTPMYNSGIPKSEYVYILTSEKYNETTIFRGEDVLPSTSREMIEAHIAEARRRDKILEELLRSQGSSHGIVYYTRPMIQHKGGKSMGNDYFVNDKRSVLENKVLELCR